MTDIILSMNQITKSFPGVLALDKATINLRKGELLSIVGENGAGKSTLMKILAGNYPYGSYSGEVMIGDTLYKAKRPVDSRKFGIAMIYQESFVNLDLTVAENIFVGNWPQNVKGFVNWPQMKARATEMLDRVGLNVAPGTQMRNLNASMKQLVCIARALVNDPKILILDEPTAALTEKETDTLKGVIRKLLSRGISCLYISHKLEEVFEISDRVVTMRDGRVVSEYTREEINPQQVVADMIGKKVRPVLRDALDENAETILRVENFQVRHPFAANKLIIQDVSFEIKRGEVLGLSGLVGSGRSELLRAIIGAIPKEHGNVIMDGKPIQIRNTRSAIKHGICMLSEERKTDGYVGTMNVMENMTLSALDRISRHKILSRLAETKLAKEYFQNLNIKAPSLITSILTLSGGNQQKIILARLLMARAKILFLDEPTRGIDIGAKSEIYRIINDLKKQGVGIVVVSSELPELTGICDRVIVLHDGVVNGELVGDQISQEAIMRHAAFS